ncbi:MAG TPA: anti-sigma factor antagonist, partial [Epsilonproteobacteria bacterium]|nr:anti-sigma factor antagonist [Campylobacterota bacterium]
MGVELTKEEDYVVAAVAYERFDVATMQEAKESFEEILESNSRIVIDMSQVSFVDSSGVSVLIGVLKRVNAKENGMLKLCGLTE